MPGLTGLSGISGPSSVFGQVAAAFSPASIAGLQLWLEADVGTYQDNAGTTPATADGDLIGYWQDQSGSGHHATQAVDGNKFTLKLNIQNGRPVARLDGGDMMFLTDAANLVIDDTCTVIVVHKTAAATRQTLLGTGNLAGSFQLEMLDAANTRSTITSSSYISKVVAPASGVWETLFYRRSGAGATHLMGVSRQPLVLTSNSATSYTANGDKVIGRRAYPASQFYTGDIGCMLIYSGALAEADWWALVTWLDERYGIEHNGLATDADLTVVYVPDLQLLTESYPDTLTAMMNRIVTLDTLVGVDMVMFEGDIVENWDVAAEWARIDTAIGLLDTAGIPYLISVGNHDYDNMVARDITTFNATFPQSRLTSHPSWNGGFYQANDAGNAYNILTVGGQQYLFLSLEFGPRQAVIDWAGGIIAANPTAEVFAVTHSHVYSDGTLVDSGDSYAPSGYAGLVCHDGDEVWAELFKLYENVRCVGSGHDISGQVANLQGVGDNSNYVLQFLANWQAINTSRMRVVQVDRTANKIHSFTLISDLWYLIDASNEFSYDYEP